MDSTVIFISLDTLRSDCLQSNPTKLFLEDYPSLKLPDTHILDTLAKEGTFFLNCITAAPYTSAAHGAIFTGQWPIKNGVYEVYNRPLRSKTIFQTAQAHGYETTFKTDFPLILGPELGFTAGVDNYLIEDDDGFLNVIAKRKAHLAFAHFGGIHYPYGFHNLRFGGNTYRQRVEELEAKYPVQAFEFPDKIDETFREHEDRELLLRYKRIVQFLYAHQLYTELFALYLEGIEFFLKTRFTPFLQKLLNCLQGRRYLLILFGDHGEQWDADSYGHHNSLHEGILRVPLIMVGSDVPAQKVIQERIRSIDILPTVLSWLNWAPDQALDGETLWPLLDHHSGPPRHRRAYAQAYNCEPEAFTKIQEAFLKTGQKTGTLEHTLTKEAIYDGPYKYVRQHYYYQNGTFGILPQANEELYHEDNLRFVPLEDPQQCAKMSALLDAYNRHYAEHETADSTEEIRQFLRDFGYKV